MEKLPDELILVVLSHVPSLDLIHSCRLVCKRWYSLCRTRSLWKNASVQVLPSSSEEISRIERVFTLAPMLGSVHVFGTPDYSTIVTMVRGCRVVSSLYLRLDRNWAIALVLLEHYKEHMESLQVLFNDELPETVLSIIASMKNLKKLMLADLELSLITSLDWTPFKVLCNSVASLKHLDVSKLVHVVFGIASAPLDAAIIKFSDSLTSLCLPSAPATAGLVEAVSYCSKLEKLEISFPVDMNIDLFENAVSQLTVLRCLNIWICSDTDSHFAMFLLRTSLFNSVKELEVGFPFPDKDNSIANAIASCCNHLEVLSLPGSGRNKNFTDKGLEKILCHATSLRRLNLCLQKAFTSSVFPILLTHLLHLEYLDVRDTYFLSSGAIEDLQHTLPKLFVRWVGEDLEEYMGFRGQHTAVKYE